MFFILTVLFALVGCTEVTKFTEPEHKSTIRFYEKPKTFEFNGHRYIYFTMNPHRGGVVYDPDCPCDKQK